MTTLHLNCENGRRLAYRKRDGGSGLTFVWLSGFKSDMSGTKVTELESWADAENHGFLAFDYSGHGESDGAFEDGTISAWLEDSLNVIQGCSEGPLVLVGSSMGGWMALLAALGTGALAPEAYAQYFAFGNRRCGMGNQIHDAHAAGANHHLEGF